MKKIFLKQSRENRYIQTSCSLRNITVGIAAAMILISATGCDGSNQTSDSSLGEASSQPSSQSDSSTSESITTDDNISSEPPSSSDTPTTSETIDSSSDSSDAPSSIPQDISAEREQIVQTAQAMIGIDYVTGKADPNEGFDNSGLIYYVLRENGYINCPRGTSGQMEMGTEIGLDEVSAGDLIFFADTDDSTGETIYFGGIYIGDNSLVYSPYPGEKVKTADIGSTYWKNCFYRAVSVS